VRKNHNFDMNDKVYTLLNTEQFLSHELGAWVNETPF